MIRYPDWIYRQSAALPYRDRDKGLEVLLITTRGGRNWALPKGIVDPGMTAATSAAKEALEEAGIEGAVSAYALGSYRQDKWGGTCHVEVFPMRVTETHETWPEAGDRRREWLPLKEAANRVKGRKLGHILRALPEHLVTAGGGEDAVTAIEKPRLIYLLRHAKSSWNDPTLDDFDRPLAPRGLRATEVMSEYLRMADVEPDLVLCSSSARTRATLAGVEAAIGGSAEHRFEDAVYEASPQTLLKLLQRVPDSVSSVMLIGHNPGMQLLALHLVGYGDSDAATRMAAKFPTAAFAILVPDIKRWQDLAEASCALHSFVVPRELA